MLRNHTCGELNQNNVGAEATLCGWVWKSRDLGGATTEPAPGVAYATKEGEPTDIRRISHRYTNSPKVGLR